MASIRASIGVVGGDLGGLAVALAARQAGSEATVYPAPLPDRSGTVVELSANAMRVLRALDLGDELDDAVRPLAHHLRTHRTGTLITHTPLGAFAADRWGAPLLQMGADCLRQRLLERARAAGTTIAPAIASTADLTAAAGRHGVLVVDADPAAGLAPVVPVATGEGLVVWYGAVDSAPGRTAAVNATWIGPRGQFGLTAGAPGEPNRMTALMRADANPATSADGLGHWFAAWPPGVRATLAAAHDLRCAHIDDCDPAPAWVHSNVVLIGDAAHPVLPVLDQGAALALEDAWVLARLLDTWEDDLSSAFADFVRYRRPRVQRVVRAARLRAAAWHEAAPRVRLWRNLMLGLKSRLLPEPALQELDWLYEYDCIRGFD